MLAACRTRSSIARASGTGSRMVSCKAIKIYTNPGSRGKIGEWALEEVGVKYETVNLDMKAGDHKKPAYLAINPFGKVPAMQDGDLTLFESGAILLHVFAKYGKLNQDQLSKAYQWTLFANSTMATAFFNKGNQMAEMLAPMEPLLAKSAFLDGDAFGVCDIAVGAYLLYLPLFYPDMFGAGKFATEYPNVWRYMLALSERDSCPSAYKEGVKKAAAAMGPAKSGNPLSGLFKK